MAGRWSTGSALFMVFRGIIIFISFDTKGAKFFALTPKGSGTPEWGAAFLNLQIDNCCQHFWGSIFGVWSKKKKHVPCYDENLGKKIHISMSTM
jgi:hypothetical protein